jgi:signal transduction histidine kinase
MALESALHEPSRVSRQRVGRTALRTAAGVAGVATASWLVVSLRDAAPADDLGNHVVVAALTAWTVAAYLIGGIVASRRWPDNHIGRLMVTAGVAFAATTLSWSTDNLAFTVGQALDKVPQVIFLHVVLAFPGGRLAGRTERVIVGTAYVVAIVLELLRMVVGDYGRLNLLGFAPEPNAYPLVRRIQLVALSGLCLAGVALLLRRRRRRRRTRTMTWRWLSLVFAGFTAALAMIAILDELLAWGGLRAFGVRELRWAAFWTLGAAPAALVAGSLESRLARSAVGDVLGELLESPSPSRLREVLSRALHDPSLRLLYWLPERRSWANAAGQPEPLPVGDVGRATTVIDQDGEPVAALLHDEAALREQDLLDAVTAAAGLALQNGRLHAELQARVQELARSRLRVVQAGRSERQQLERNLHDGAQQRLVTLALEVSLMQARSAGNPAVLRRLERIKAEIATSLEELRAVARGIHPAVLSAHGLSVALESLVASSPVPVRLEVEVEGRLHEAIEVTAYYLVRECLAQIARRTAATSASVRIASVEGLLVLEISDDEMGDDELAPQSGPSEPGLSDLADQVEALGGRLRQWSSPDGGTRMRAVIPCP